MPINYSVQAEVIDITKDTPTAQDTFLVDTNVWYWLAYTRASMSSRPPARYQILHYPQYTNSALNANAKIYQSGLSIAELTHLIEKAEHDIYLASNPKVTSKEYRHNHPVQRSKVVAEVKAACGQVGSLGQHLEFELNAPVVSSALNRLSTVCLDGYDLFILESMQRSGVVQVITDDGDFATVPGIQVFTANRNVIQAARANGKLIAR